MYLTLNLDPKDDNDDENKDHDRFASIALIALADRHCLSSVNFVSLNVLTRLQCQGAC